MLIYLWLEIICEVEVFLHKECYVNGCNSEEEVTLFLTHALNSVPLFLDKVADQIQ